jgi:hypothetical protein
MVQQRKLENLGGFVSQILKIPYWLQWMCWNPTGNLFRMSSKLTRHVLIHMFVGFWPKKRKEMPDDNLRKLLAAFDTIKDHVLAMKCTSVKRGVEGAIALAQSHGEEVD